MVDAQDEKKTKESLGWASYEPFHRECFYVTGIHPRNQNLIKKKYFIPISRIPVVETLLMVVSSSSSAGLVFLF